MRRSYRRSNVALPDWYRWLLITASTLILCSCQSLSRSPAPDSPGPASTYGSSTPAAAPSPPSPAPPPAGASSASLSDGGPVQPAAHHHQPAPARLPLSAFTGPDAPYHGQPRSVPSYQSCPQAQLPPGSRQPHAPLPWAPPGIRRPWPESEYLCDGGDRLLEVQVANDWTVQGLDQEDTVAHFDTLDGRTEVTPSNRVCIYAPRFASVRKVTGLVQHEQHLRSAGVDNPQRLAAEQELGVPNAYLQPLQPGHNVANKALHIFRENEEGIEFSKARRLYGLSSDLLPFEDSDFIRTGKLDNSEKARLSEYIAAAFTWSTDQAVQVVIDETVAHTTTGQQKSQETRLYEMPPGKPRVRICKLASRSSALPGDEVSFTIRFDNVGDQEVGNVTIVDNLTTRLEYIEGTAECSVKADFFTLENDGDSLILRWEIVEPLDVSQGGVIRFKCRVR